MKVLLAVDGSPYTKRMLAYLGAHDELLSADVEFTILNVVPGIPPHAARFLPQADLQGYYDSEAEAVLEPVRAFVAQQRWHAEFRRAHGVPADRIVELAQAGDFDLVVLGSHGHSALGNVLLGSVATRVLAGCRVPVLIIR
jgi:nucleotide-binding universal stress UspA family protein